MESPRTSTTLASTPFKDLTVDQLNVIKIVDPSITSSLRYFGIKILLYGKKSKKHPQLRSAECDLQVLHRGDDRKHRVHQQAGNPDLDPASLAANVC